MTQRSFAIAVFLLLLAAVPVRANVIVDLPISITHRVTVNAVTVANDDGSIVSTAFGNTTQRNYILSQIDAVWAQVGIDVEFKFSLGIWNNNAARIGSGTGLRPAADLSAIVSASTTAGFTDPSPTVLNLYFVERVPGFELLSENTSAGLAFTPGNGMAIFVGDNLLGFNVGMDVIAGVVAHEIGHNLGLAHTASNIANLMSPGGSTDQLTAAQGITARGSSFAVVIPEPSSMVLCVLAGGALILARRRN